MTLVRRLRNSLRRFNNERRARISIEFRKWIPRMRVVEKYEGFIKWTLRIVIGVGIASALLTLPWYLAVLLAVALAVTEQVLERSVFLYTSLYVQPMPYFRYEPDEWLGIMFARFLDGDDESPIVAPIFRTSSYAREFFQLLCAWNYQAHHDRDNNICMSFIIEDMESYSAYFYPNLERRSVKEFSEWVEDEGLRHKPGKEHFGLVMAMMICHMFDYSIDSHLEDFRVRYQPGEPFWLAVAALEEGSPELLPDVDWILKFDVKIKARSELVAEDMELEHGRLMMDA